MDIGLEHIKLNQANIEQPQDLAAEQHRLQQLKAARKEVTEQLNTLVAEIKIHTFPFTK